MDLVNKPRSKSMVWMYFGLKADERGQPLNADEAVCRLCRKVVLSKGNTTNLRSHLRRRHPAHFFEINTCATPGALSEPHGADVSHEDLFEDIPFLQATANSNYVPDAVLPPGEPWLFSGPPRATLSLPSCLCLCEQGGSGAAGPGCSGEDRVELKVYAKCQIQQSVMFGPFVGEVCRGQMPSNLRYAWAVRDEAAFMFLDASDENKSNWMRYVTYTSVEEEHNLVVFQFYRHIYYRVSQPISEGAELKVWIGKDYASLLGLGTGDNMKCEIGEKEEVLRLLQDIQLVTLPEPSSTSLWSDSSQSQSPMPVISDVTTVSNSEAASDPGGMASPAFPSTCLIPLPSPSTLVTDKYDFLPGTEKLLSNPNLPLNSPWHFFGLEPGPTGRPLDRSTAVCKLCMERVSCGGGAADLQTHLTSKHHIKPRETAKDRSMNADIQDVRSTSARLGTAGPPRSQTSQAAGALVSTSSPVMPAQVTNAIATFLVMDLQPPALVEGEGFRQLLHALLPSYRELPVPCQLHSLLRDHHIRGKVSLSHLLRRRSVEAEPEDYTAPIEFEPRRRRQPSGRQKGGCHTVTLSVDVWLHSWQGNADQYLTLWAHYIDDHFSPHNVALATQRLVESGEYERGLQAVEAQVKVMMQEWGISHPNLVLLGVEGRGRAALRPVKGEKGVEAAGGLPHPNSTTFPDRDGSLSPDETNAPEHGHFSEGLVSVPCFFRAAQGCVEEVMSHPLVLKALGQFQELFSTVFLASSQSKGSQQHHAWRLLQGLSKQERGRLKSWAHSRPTWNGLYPLLSTLLRHKAAICDTIKEMTGEVLTKEEAVSDAVSPGNCHTNSPTNPPSGPWWKWKVLEELCSVLKPLDVACQTLAREAFPRLSLIKPILTGLLSRHLVSRPGDSSLLLKEVKRTMRRSLADCYDGPAVNRVLSVACSLDPQFHGLGFMEEKEQTATFTWLKKEAVRIVHEDRRWAPNTPRPKRSSSPESPEAESELVRRSKRLKECPPINFAEVAGEVGGDEDDSDGGEADGGEAAAPGPQAGLSGMEFLLGDLFCSTSRSRQSSVEESVDTEISVFRANKGPALRVEPLQWWRTQAGQFPLLARVARAYLAAPAVAGNAAQDFVKEEAGTSQGNRSNIPPESLDAILFLHHNRISITDAAQAAAAAAARADDRNSWAEKSL
ncbi:uncharacterized protein LOC133446598 isoform X2 [Cololabis saira]|uniref:uncharacterized protein LOC133446598 isoform X2 n=1 Tax=Cololabis saira TaxID=129043 RepID=UPI002AD3CFDF|nr:uncharacterized protein LOC133446598 isoform X2 [Cololabis saira]